MNLNLPELINLYFAALSFAWGACIGSFANVCIYRIPRGESVVKPRSHCPHCGRTIAWYDNIPLFSIFALRQKCRNCAGPIASRYFFVELVSAAIFMLIWLRYGLDARTPVYMLMVLGLVVGSFIDVDHLILPDRITVGGMLIGPALSLAFPALHGEQSHYLGLRASLIGLAFGAGLLGLIAGLGTAAFKREAMGMGDVKLMGAIGALLGWQACLFTVMLSSLIGAGVGVALIALRSKTFGSKIPYGPFIAIAAVAWMLGGSDLWDAYIRFIMMPE
ncbi:MAG: prepilin peptidase [Lentisphaerae bacterium]|nr:prepilin peptidase [Lentisphaerota bacterium]